MTRLADGRLDTHKRRQVICDQDRGRTDETTVDDELGGGDGLDKALQYAMTPVQATQLTG
jgi:hypothetical protein